MSEKTVERTFLMVKPDGVQRGLVGEIIRRIEKPGLKIIAMKMVQAKRDQVEKFYPSERSWFETIGKKTTKAYEELGLDIKSTFGTVELEKIGKTIKKWLIDFIIAGPVVPMIIEGNSAVKKVRDIVGYTDPYNAAPGTIRGDLTSDSIALGNVMGRAAVNLVHASSDVSEAKREISLWFEPKEILNYKRTDEDVVLGRFLKK